MQPRFAWTCIFISLVYISWSLIAASCDQCMFNFVKNCQTVSTVAVLFAVPNSNVGGSRLFTPLLAVAIVT